MRHLSKIGLLALAAIFTITSCKKAAVVNQEDVVAPEVVNQIKNMGFNTSEVQKVENGYIVEKDIFIPNEDLGKTPGTPEMVIANEEHYRTNNLVTGLPRTIRVSVNTTQSNFVQAVDEAIRRYNALNLRINFQRVSSNANINIVTFFENSNTLGSAGFPSGGNPFGQIRLNTRFYTPSVAVNPLATTIAHEMGHCIGFRHTDYMNRSFSCGGVATNEGSAGIGAVYIPGTPTGPSSGSWMLSCGSTTLNRPFTSSDVTALNFVY
jgi:hypothetical protein